MANLFPQPSYDVPSELDFALSPAASGADINQFLQSATAQLTTLAGQQKEQARQEESLSGMGRSGILSSRLAGIDQGARNMMSDLFRKVAMAKAQQQYQQQVEQEQEKKLQDALEQRKSQSQNIGLAQILGGVAGGIAAPFTGGLINPIEGAALGGELAGDVTGLQYGQTPTAASLGMIGSKLNAPKPFDFKGWLDEYLGKNQPALPATGPSTSYSTLPSFS